eukprot:UN25249
MDPITRQPGYYETERYAYNTKAMPYGLYRPSRDPTLPRLIKADVYDREPPREPPRAPALPPSFRDYYPKKSRSRDFPAPPITKQPLPQSEDGEVRDWTSGILDCTTDINTCFASFFCPCCLECWLSDKMDEGCVTPVCLPGAAMAL